MAGGLSPRARGLLAAATTASMWSFLAILIKLALNYADAQTIVWYRMITASVLTTGLLFLSKRQNAFSVLLSKPGPLLIAALCLAANYFGYMKAVELTSPANAQVFIQVGPMLLALAGVVFFKEKLGALQILGVAICLAGFGVFFADKLGHTQGDYDNYMLGQMWIFMAAVTWAVFATLQKTLLKTWSPNQINLYIYLVSTLVFFPTVDWTALAEAPLFGHFLFGFLGFITLAAYGCLAIALKYLPAIQVSPIITLNPLGTLVLIYLLEQTTWNLIPADPISAAGYLGAMMAVTGVILIVTQKAGPSGTRR